MVPFLSKAEKDYLLAGDLISSTYNCFLKHTLTKKVDLFVKHELPLLMQKGYVKDFRIATDSSNAWVAQPSRARGLLKRLAGSGRMSIL